MVTNDITEVSGMGSYLNPGCKGFEESLNSAIYVDKTGLIEKINAVVNTRQKYICVSRPRRFGKSMATDMLAAYYDQSVDTARLFDTLQIAKAETYQKYRNQYDVLKVNMQEFLSMTHSMDEMLAVFQKRMIADLKRGYPDYVMDGEDSLVFAMKDVYAHTKCPFIILIDEWDCLFREYKQDKEAQKKYLDFLCATYKRNFEEAQAWYDGYELVAMDGENPKIYSMYSPKSVVDAMLSGLYDNYWNQTETYEALKIYIQMNFDGLKDAIVRMLAGDRVEINTGTFSNDMTTFQNRDDVLTLLVHLGYLSYHWMDKTVSIPNKEVSQEYVNAISTMDWHEVIDSVEASKNLLEALWMQDEEAVAAGIDKAHREISILQYNNENSLACTINLAFYFAREYYTIIREFPTGKGFADLCFIPRKMHADKPAVVIELKWEKSAQGAIAQIKDRHYTDALKEYRGNLLLAGINYNRETKTHTCVIEQLTKED